MFKTQKTLKSFINWAKSEGIQKLSVKSKDLEVDIVFSDVAMIEKYTSEPLKVESESSSKTWTDSEQIDPKEEEELLYYSSRS